MQGYGLGGQQCRAQLRQGRILCTGNQHLTVQAAAAANQKFVHGVGALNRNMNEIRLKPLWIKR